ncbi:peptidylprolyl isomerase [Endozoicomonas sp. G2_1]|uniref:peptidylprolyl isomerase n=1 Tax=Endozoicomonas sp. G2_1 TaxID=2821091 RepID=UPI001ADD4DC1|nr:peptidylprolyl isomerase [Endozoicomonas sp. G2_1]MBO9491813.1 peptidylprolyl isomerase [Endozoicomonas sp. G2_1]
MSYKNFGKLAKTVILASGVAFSAASHATIVEFQTSQGNFQVNLYDQNTPITVANFLSYINNGNYNNTVIHRSVSRFVVQGGGFSFQGQLPLTPIATLQPIQNEPVFSNVRGTISMAKVAGNVNSATSQWFFNLADNSANLDRQNGGFTAFGQVIGDGMTVVDRIAGLPICNNIPMPGTTVAQCADSNYVPGQENFVTINNIVIVDSSNTTASGLTPARNTSLGGGSNNGNNNSSSDSGGGSTGLLAIGGLLALYLRKSMKKALVKLRKKA